MDIPPRLLRKASNLDLPVLALSAIVELRRALDHLETEAISSARSKGASWEDIAAALGVTRQALQQRVKHANGAG